MANSDYYHRISQLVEDIDRSFTNHFHLIQPFQDTDYLPGDRYGLLTWQSIDSDPDRLPLEMVRGGVEAKVASGGLLLTIAFEGTGLSDELIYRKANTIFMQEAIDIHHRLALMLKDIYDQGFVYDLVVDSAIDKSISIALRDKSTCLVRVTCDVALKFMIHREIDGLLKLPLNTINTYHHG